MKLPIGPSDYYEPFPDAQHQAGDIWVGLPTYGVLSADRLSSLVITPACDLVNRKVETLTYLPILSVNAFIASRSYLTEVLRAISGQLEAAGIGPGLAEERPPALPRIDALQVIRRQLNERRRGGRLNKREEAATARADAGLEAAVQLLGGAAFEDLVPMLRVLFGENAFLQTARRIVTNSHRSDIHFLPPDEQPREWSAIREPSVVLFRYPMSVPIDILDLAGAVSEVDWPGEVLRLRGIYPCAEILASRRPLKTLNVRPRFLSDLLTRFTGLYGRIGCPDFTDGTIDRYVGRIGGPS